MDLFRSYIYQAIAYLDISDLKCPDVVVDTLAQLFGRNMALPSLGQVLQEAFIPLHEYLVRHVEECTYVVDGLDEVSPIESRAILRSFQRLKNARIFIAARDNFFPRGANIGRFHIMISESVSRADIRSFIDWKFDDRTECDRPLTTNPSLVDEAKDALNARAHLMQVPNIGLI
jgi:hypothetical protein